MKKFAAIAFAATIATPGLAMPPEATQFNGYSLTLVVPNRADFNFLTIPDDTTSKADRICESVGKKAEAQSITKISNTSASVFYLCL